MVSIIYDYPGPPRIAAAERGDIVLGGCTTGEGAARPRLCRVIQRCRPVRLRPFGLDLAIWQLPPRS